MGNNYYKCINLLKGEQMYYFEIYLKTQTIYQTAELMIQLHHCLTRKSNQANEIGINVGEEKTQVFSKNKEYLKIFMGNIRMINNRIRIGSIEEIDEANIKKYVLNKRYRPDKYNPSWFRREARKFIEKNPLYTEAAAIKEIEERLRNKVVNKKQIKPDEQFGFPYESTSSHNIHSEENPEKNRFFLRINKFYKTKDELEREGIKITSNFNSYGLSSDMTSYLPVVEN